MYTCMQALSCITCTHDDDDDWEEGNYVDLSLGQVVVSRGSDIYLQVCMYMCVCVYECI